MELKRYQSDVLDDIERFLECLDKNSDPAVAYSQTWDDKGYITGKDGIPSYKKEPLSAPNVCIKVPTGGGKTFIACAALKKIFNTFPRNEKFVLWLVPSSMILEQTKAALGNPNHPYRQKINADFSGKVNVYGIEDLLLGHDFNSDAIQGQLSICVLSYSSLRTNNPDNRRMYRENGYLRTFLNKPGFDNELIPGDNPSLMRLFNVLSPVIVLDESHNAGSELSKKMLVDLNPSFVLELTATPKKDSNLISVITAGALKDENMVKIPIIIYERDDIESVLATTKSFRDTLEASAIEEMKSTGRYVRPIALIQAQPKTKDDSVTFNKVKNILMKMRIPEEQIAIKVSGDSSLDRVDLLDKTCPIRYIITVNALKEGWDCPFAYILSSISQRSSNIEVEQIVGRILRQPGASRFSDPVLNMSYVFTSSKTFSETVNEVTKGLKVAGFSEKDYRIGESPKTLDSYIDEPEDPKLQQVPITDEEGKDELDGIDTERINVMVEKPPIITNPPKEQVEKGEVDITNPGGTDAIDDLRKKAEAYDKNRQDNDDGGIFIEHDRRTKVRPRFEEDIKTVKVPRILYKANTLFDNDARPISRGALSKGFKLTGCDSAVNFSNVDVTVGSMDIDKDSRETLQLHIFTDREREDFNHKFRECTSPDDKEVSECIASLTDALDGKFDCVDRRDLRSYIDRIIRNQDLDTINTIRRDIPGAALAIRSKVNNLMEEYQKNRFYVMYRADELFCDTSDPENCYMFAEKMDPRKTMETSYEKSLYEKVNQIGGFEESVLRIIDGTENVKWWHRVVERGSTEFCINGYKNHYPDFVVMTRTGKIVFIESKGKPLDGTDSQDKASMSEIWESLAGPGFKYYMVFDVEQPKIKQAITLRELSGYLNRL